MNSKVAVLSTSPKTVVKDYSQIMDLVDYKSKFSKSVPTTVKINLSWTLFYPACSTPPWQLHGTIKKLIHDGYTDLIPVENQTVVTHPWKGAYLNKWMPILDRYNLKFRSLTDEEWVPIKPKHDMLGMYELYDQIIVPKKFLNSNIIHLPTFKTHGHTVTTGAMKNAFGGLIPKYRHHSHKIIDEILVDLLAIQKEIHPGLLAIMDGTVAGNGAGPRTMKPYYPNVLLASEDQVAIDAAAAHMMGFDPLKIKYIKLAHDAGLGCGDVDQLDIVGMDRSEYDLTNYHCKTKESLVITWDKKIRKTTYRKKWLKPLHWFMFYSPFFKLFVLASGIFHDYFWYPAIGRKYIHNFYKTEWGEKFLAYPYGEKPEKFPEIKSWNSY